MNEGKQLARSLVFLTGRHLRFVYVLLNDVKLWDIVSSKTKDVVSKERSAHFYTWLSKEAEKLNGVGDRELQLDLLLYLSKTLKLPGRLYNEFYEIETQCANIVEAVFSMSQKKYKQFSNVYEQFSNKNKLEFLVHWELAEMYTHLNEQNQSETEETSSMLWTEEIVAFLRAMPNYQQEQVRQQLSLHACTANELSEALQKDVFAVFTAICERAGFRFYQELLQSFSRKEAANVHDIAYFSWMTHPNLLLSLIFKGGGILYRYQHLLFNKGLLPIVLLQTTLPFLSEGGENQSDLSPLSTAWQQRFEHYCSLLRAVNELVKKRNDGQTALDILYQEQKTLEGTSSQTNNYYEQMLQKLTQLLKQDPSRPYFGELSVKQNRLQENLRKVNEKIEAQQASTRGLIGKVSSFMKSSYYGTEKAQLEKKLEKVFSEITETVLEKYPDYAPEITQEIILLRERLAMNEQKLMEIKKKIHELEENLLHLKNNEKEEREKIAIAEKQTYGLAEMYQLVMEKENKQSIH
ncbi:hypothetical protein [Bacillus sp. FJAT-42315]|uniref:hypothetical protein n=1 Tax=Bacillus sp. FJAT-42315 TaxID=2014077 RepID=UPI000C230B32|nr:hypothetical protein [Bacillus sp. FJAT-42315]